ncbi:MAG: hypothetical protein JWR27_351 [Aeromicrobium sp.]|nr:hypothetical protein [Aeromicrobium sp.]
MAATTVQQPSAAHQPPYGTFDGPPATTETTKSEATDATSAQEVGLVYVNTTLDYRKQGGRHRDGPDL